MGNIITIQVPDTADNKMLVAQLIGVAGVKIQSGPVKEEWVSLRSGAAVAGVNYFTFRKWVVEQKKIPYSRPSGASQGGVRMKLSDIEKFLENKAGRRKRKGRCVEVLG